MTREWAAFLVLALVSGCVAMPLPHPAPTVTPSRFAPAPDRVAAVVAARNFVSVVARMVPMIERECDARARGINCDYLIVVDDRPDAAPNAFQTLDRDGRPIIAFTLSLIGAAHNEDELAFIMGHEAAHHIAGHLARSQSSAMTGALIFGTLASLGGGSQASVQSAQQIGANVGARRFSQAFELEADALGTEIAFDAGFDPARGALFFDRLPDPGNQFLGTHPPNAEREEVVRETLLRLRGY